MIILLLHILIFTAVYMLCWYAIGQWQHDNTWVDVAWGLGFVCIAWFTLFSSSSFMLRQIITTTLVTVWGLRLSLHIFMRHQGKAEDVRYQKLRTLWGQQEPVKSLIYIYLFQGFLMILISASVIVINNHAYTFTILDVIGTCIWIIGFAFEALGDYQLRQFLKDHNNKGAIMDQGLWHYTRHPNYFGESVMWWGIWVLSLSVGYGLFTLISPVLITYLLVYASGIPLNEEQFKENESYQEYKKKTSAFLPWPSTKD